MPALPVGTQAPDFSLGSHQDKPFALNSYRGKKTVVAFLPFAFTGG
jgi:peroxiredoxin